MLAVLFVSVYIAAASAVPASMVDVPPQNGPKACPSTTPGPGEHLVFNLFFFLFFFLFPPSHFQWFYTRTHARAC